MIKCVWFFSLFFSCNFQSLIVSISKVSTAAVTYSFVCLLFLFLAWITARLWSFYYKVWFDSKHSRLGMTAVLLHCGVTRLATRVPVCRAQVHRKHGERGAVMSLLKVQESSLDVCVPWIHHIYLLSFPSL